MRHSIRLALAGLLLPARAQASETVTYNYDAVGRLTNVTRGGSVNSGIITTYRYDKADSRVSVDVTGSSFESSVRVLVVPLNGVTVIPLGGSARS